MMLCRTLADIGAAAAADPPDPVRPQEWADRVAVLLAPHLPAAQPQAA